MKLKIILKETIQSEEDIEYYEVFTPSRITYLIETYLNNEYNNGEYLVSDINLKNWFEDEDEKRIMNLGEQDRSYTDFKKFLKENKRPNIKNPIITEPKTWKQYSKKGIFYRINDLKTWLEFD